MNKKRKDHKGRILRTGEYQRKDLRYSYRYTDPLGKRRQIYSMDLKELRKKEDELKAAFEQGLPYDAGSVSVIELLERYIALKQGVRHATKVGYKFVLNIAKKEAFCHRKIDSIRTSDAKLWFVKLQKDGRGYSTITSIRGVIKPAFQMAVDDDVLMKNPFAFNLSGVVINDSKRRVALTPEQQKVFMNFVREDRHYCRYYDEFNILLGKGMRVSEFCGLTKSDVDFSQKRIYVERQLVKEAGGIYHIEKTKTASGIRFIPMTDSVARSFQNILKNRGTPKKEVSVDGYSGFILLDSNGNPKVAYHLEHDMHWTMKKYRKLHADDPLPTITPHVLRHTFCTNMAYAGMDVKNLQYIMGHSAANVTMNIYTHANYSGAKKAMQRISQLELVEELTEEESRRNT